MRAPVVSRLVSALGLDERCDPLAATSSPTQRIRRTQSGGGGLMAAGATERDVLIAEYFEMQLWQFISIDEWLEANNTQATHSAGAPHVRRRP